MLLVYWLNVRIHGNLHAEIFNAIYGKDARQTGSKMLKNLFNVDTICLRALVFNAVNLYKVCQNVSWSWIDLS